MPGLGAVRIVALMSGGIGGTDEGLPGYPAPQCSLLGDRHLSGRPMTLVDDRAHADGAPDQGQAALDRHGRPGGRAEAAAADAVGPALEDGIEDEEFHLLIETIDDKGVEGCLKAGYSIGCSLQVGD
jgi:hypothetical protein